MDNKTKLEQVDKVLPDIRELYQRMVAQGDMQLVGLDVRFVESGEIQHIEYKSR